jgi:hypothetical protein
MRLFPIAVVLAGIAVAGSAMAAGRATDVDYLNAARCRGIAGALSADTSALDAFLKAQGRTRIDYILQKADDEQRRGARDAKSPSHAAAATAELSGPCQAFRN